MLKLLLRKFAGTALLFSGVVGLGTSCALLLSSSLGYLPYSDRPGPGWWGGVHWPSWAEAANYIEFAPVFAYFCCFFGLGLFVLALILEFVSSPRWLNRLLGGLIAAAAAGLAVAGGGWYFALAAIGSDVALVLGLLYGVFLFPNFIEARARPVALWIRISSASSAVALFVYWIVSPFLPHEPIAAINYNLIRVTAGEQQVASGPLLGPEIATDLSALNLHGQTHGGISGAGGGTGNNAPQIDMELIALEPITEEVKLAIPKKGHVVYVLKDGEWTAYPSIAQKDRRTVTLRPGTDARFDGGSVRLGKEGNFNAFTWYPGIARGQ